MQLSPTKLQHLTAAVCDIEVLSCGCGLAPCAGQPSAKLPAEVTERTNQRTNVIMGGQTDPTVEIVI